MMKTFLFACRFVRLNFNRSIATFSQIDVEIEMKKLNRQKRYSDVLNLFDQIKTREKLNDRIVVQALNACTQLKSTVRGQHIHNQLDPRALKNDYILSSLIHFYMQCRDVKNAERIFATTKNKSVVLYGTMMKGYLVNDMAKKAVEIFQKINDPNEITIVLLLNSCVQLNTEEAFKIGQQIISTLPKSYSQNKFLLTSALKMFVHYGDVSNAEKIFSMMKSDVIDYGQMMKCFNQAKMPLRTLQLHQQMKDENIQSDLITYILLVDACTQIGIQSTAESIFKEIPETFRKDYRCQTALFHMWGKCGSVKRAKDIFDKIITKDIVTYTAMINTYGLNGMGSEAVALFNRIPHEIINDHTYVCVLNACSHSRLVNEARTIFSTISTKDKMIYTAMVDCLSRASLFDEAQQLIKTFEQDHSPCLPMYMALLSGVRNANDSSLAEQINERIQKLFADLKHMLGPASILLANTLASSGESDKASTLRWRLSQSGTKKQPGLSWTEVNNNLVEFRAHDRSHPRSNEIYAEVNQIAREVIQHGHKFDASWITRPMMPDETVESILNGHSERLALAFNFINKPVPSIIQISKNLRICGDCHELMKLVSQIRACQIIIRDANRMHHFIDGKCSCGDRF